METTVALDTLWVLLGGILVFWMQAGLRWLKLVLPVQRMLGIS